MKPIVAEVLAKQLVSLRRIYLIMGLCLLGIVVAVLLLGASPMGLIRTTTLMWTEAGLAGLAAVLLLVVLPLVRKKLLDPERVRTAGPELLRSWGLTEGVEPSLGRQVVYLTRYTAGCVVSWGLAASVGLYGLVASMLGATPVVTAAFLSAAAFALLVLPPRQAWVQGVLEKLELPAPR